MKRKSVQALVERWDALIGQYGAEAAAGLNAAYAQIAAAPDAEHMPPEVQAWAAELQAAANFIQRAKAILTAE
ncbi:MAG TPA: hypothetical protein VHO69_05435 [Phototrophicaceae bacterium]|nr:hypothetical protein [Phototrophicaceae bacterium]